MEKETLKETIKNWMVGIVFWSIMLIVAIVAIVLYYALNLRAISSLWNILNIIGYFVIGLSVGSLFDIILSIKERRDYLSKPLDVYDDYDW